MLVIQRKLGERLVIGDNIYVAVLTVQGTRVKLGILAPSDVSIVREELLHKQDKNDRQTAS